MDLNEYIGAERGRGAKLAEALAIAPELISQWKTGARAVPIERCYPIEEATAGAVTRRDLRPEDWHRIWPELVDGEHPAPIAPASEPATQG